MIKDEDKNRQAREDYRDDEARKPDWRELDRRKDRSGHRSPETTTDATRSPSAARRSAIETEHYKKQLEELFKVKPSKVQEKQLKKIRQSRGRDIDVACQEFITQFGFPKDWESLMVFLDATHHAIVAPVVQQLALLYPQESATRQTLFKQRLRLLLMTQSDRTFKRDLEALIAQLG